MWADGGIEVEGTFFPSPRVDRAEAEPSSKQGRGWGTHTPYFQSNLAEPRTQGKIAMRQVAGHSNQSSITMCLCPSLSRVCLFATPWTIAPQAPRSMGFSRQEHWSGLPRPSAGDIPDPGIEPRSPAFQTDSLPSELPGNHKNHQTG